VEFSITTSVPEPRKVKWRKNNPGKVHAARTKMRANRNTEFICIDGEGQTGKCRQCNCKHFTPGPMSKWRETCGTCGHYRNATQGNPRTGHFHDYVLLGVGDKQITSPEGLGWEEIFEFLYSQFDDYATYTGFFLGYDFTQWFKGIPESKAFQLLTQEGIVKRKYKAGDTFQYHPVKIQGKRTAGDVAKNIPTVQNAIWRGDLDTDTLMVWELHLHADRRLMIRPKICCKTMGDTHVKKTERDGTVCRKASGMYVCDAGQFFQSAFLKVIQPTVENWGDHPIVSAEEYGIVDQGKSDRATVNLGPEMMRYNRLENEIFSRVLEVYDTGFKAEDINLRKWEWYGPGQSAAKWLKTVLGKDFREAMEKTVTRDVLNAARKTYYGGWFECMAHGIITGTSYEYDINSAYPHIISQLPCLLHNPWTSSKPAKPRKSLPALGERQIRLVEASVWGDDPYIGTMLHRTMDGSILRPSATRGWFWQHELEAAKRAGVVNRVECYEWHTLTFCDVSKPCGGLPPLAEIKHLYQKRLDAGKATAYGKSMKLNINSAYGKFAQSIGEPPYANPIYASLITAGCRTMILDSIATHPNGTRDVLMVATDGIYFRNPHPGLPVSCELGEWEKGTKKNLTLFKPGVYWDDKARAAIHDGGSPEFKSRGVSAREMATQVKDIDTQFRAWRDQIPADEKQWPSASFPLTFSMTSAKQAIRGKWEHAGLVTDRIVTHSSWPGSKRLTTLYGGAQQEACGQREPCKIIDGIARSRPRRLGENSEGLPQLSMGYNKTLGVTARSENGQQDPEQYGLTPEGLASDSWYEAMQMRG
jgi:hypothetical protein